jgi:GST-like protein
MITLYNTATSPNGQKVRILLEETRTPYAEVMLRRDAGENRAPEYLSISPTGAVPAIVDDDTGASVFESSAILIYLAEKAGRFLPLSQPARADAFKWLMFEVANIDPACENIYQLCYADHGGAEEGLAFQRDKLRGACALVEDRLAGHEYLAGECSIADFALFPWMAMFEDFAQSPLSDYPAIERWLDAMRARPAVQRATQAPGTG